MERISKLFNKHLNQPIIILGASPSLIDFNFSLLEGCLTIGLNRAVYAPVKLTYWFYSEKLGIFHHVMERAKKEGTLQVCRRPTDNPDYLFFNAPNWEERSYASDQLTCRQSVTVGALDFANFLGCKQVALIGCDFLCKGRKRYFDETADLTINIGETAQYPYTPDGEYWYPNTYTRYIQAIRNAIRLLSNIEVTVFSDKTLLSELGPISRMKILPRSAFAAARKDYLCLPPTNA